MKGKLIFGSKLLFLLIYVITFIFLHVNLNKAIENSNNLNSLDHFSHFQECFSFSSRIIMSMISLSLLLIILYTKLKNLYKILLFMFIIHTNILTFQVVCHEEYSSVLTYNNLLYNLPFLFKFEEGSILEAHIIFSKQYRSQIEINKYLKEKSNCDYCQKDSPDHIFNRFYKENNIFYRKYEYNSKLILTVPIFPFNLLNFGHSPKETPWNWGYYSEVDDTLYKHEPFPYKKLYK